MHLGKLRIPPPLMGGRFAGTSGGPTYKLCAEQHNHQGSEMVCTYNCSAHCSLQC